MKKEKKEKKEKDSLKLIRHVWKEHHNQFIILHSIKITKNYGALHIIFLKNKESNMEILL